MRPVMAGGAEGQQIVGVVAPAGSFGDAMVQFQGSVAGSAVLAAVLLPAKDDGAQAVAVALLV